MHDALSAEHRTRYAMQSAQWTHDNAAPEDYRDAEEPEDDEPEQPAHRPLFNVTEQLAEAEQAGKDYDARIGGTFSVATAYECGVLREKLRRAADLIDMLQRELQTAINDGVCHSYIDAHLNRVERTCGVVVPKEYRE